MGSKGNILDKLQIKKSDLVDSNGQLRDLSTIFEVINKHTKNLDSVDKGVIFKSLFGTTGSQAGAILAANYKELRSLTGEVEKAGKNGTYVQQLAKKNGETAKQAQAQFKQAVTSVQMSLGTALLPTISKVSKALEKFLLSKDGQKFQKDFGNVIAHIADKLGSFIDFLIKNRKKVVTTVKSLLIAWGLLKGIKVIGVLAKLKDAIKGVKAVSDVSNLERGLTGIGNTFRKLKNILKNIKFKSLGSGLLTRLKSIGTKGASLAKSAGKKISSAFTKSLDLGKGLFGKGQGAGKLTGLLQSAHSAGGFNKLSTAGKVGTGLAGIGVAATAGVDIYQGLKAKTKKGKYEGIGKGVGSAIGGGIGLWFGGPLGAAIGTKIGETVGKWGGKAVLSFQKGWKSKKPPKKFWSLENLGWSTHDAISKAIKWGSNVVKSFSKGIKSAIKWVKSNAKELVLTFISPIIGIPALLYKNNPKFRKWADSIFKGLKNAWKGMTKWISNLGKNMVKFWKKAWDGIGKWFGNIGKGIQRGWNGLTSWIGKLGHNMVKTFKGAWDGITKWFNDLIKPIKDGFNAIINAPAKLWKRVTGHAAGTNWQGKYPELAMLNDGNDSPATNNREGIIHKDGSIEIVKGRNVLRLLMPGEEVIKASDMARMFGRAVRHANGTIDLANKNFEKKTITIDNKLDDKDLTVNLKKLVATTDKIHKEAKKKNDPRKPKQDPNNPTDQPITHKKGWVTIDKGFFSASGKLTGQFITVKKSEVEAFNKKLVAATKASRRKTSRTRRNSSEKSSNSGSTTSYSKVEASVTGSKSIESLEKLISKVKGTHGSKIKFSVSGTKSLNGINDKLKKVKSSKKIKVSVTGVKDANKNLSSLTSKFKSLSKAIKTTSGGAKDYAALTKKLKTESKSLEKTLTKDWDHTWDTNDKKFKSYQKKTVSLTKALVGSLKKDFTSLSTTTIKIFNKMLSSLVQITGKAINRVIKVLNSGINQVNKVISEFGGKKATISTAGMVKYATGTGFFSNTRRAITKPTMAVVNDGNDSPETGNQEAIYRPSTGQIGLFKGRNIPTLLMPGDEIFNATETKALGLTHFATGTGYLKKLYKEAENYISKPTKSLHKMFNFKPSGKGGINQIVKGVYDKADKQVSIWWKQLWDMVQEKIDDSTSDEDATGLLKAVEKYGEGHKYVWGAEGPNVFDCSGLVKYALKKMGIDYPHFSGSQYAQSKKISEAEAKPGDLVFFGPGGGTHVGVYAGGNKIYSAMNERDGIGMSTISSFSSEGKPLFARVPGLKHKESDPKVKADNKLQKKIKDQVGKGFWKTINKIADEFGFGNMSGHAATMGMIEAAAKKMHVNLPPGYAKRLMQVIVNESGNRSIMQQIHDVNSGGNEARGILQYVPGTFANYAMPGHKNIWNPYDQLLAFFNNSDWRNAIGMTTIWGRTKMDWLHSGPQGHRRFANGGIVSSAQLAWVGEGRDSEAIIPWDITKRGRAYQLLDKTLKRFKADDPTLEISKEPDYTQEFKNLSAKFDQLLSLVSMLLAQPQLIQTDVKLDGRTMAQQLSKYNKILNKKNFNKAKFNLA